MFKLYKRREGVTVDCSNDKILTEQSHKDACDMHRIMRQYQETGIITHAKQYAGKYMDMADAMDFQRSMNIVTSATQMFETVPSQIRKKFGNDPAAFLDFVQNPENYDSIKEMGLDVSHLPPPKPSTLQDDPAPPTPAEPQG